MLKIPISITAHNSKMDPLIYSCSFHVKFSCVILKEDSDVLNIRMMTISISQFRIWSKSFHEKRFFLLHQTPSFFVNPLSSSSIRSLITALCKKLPCLCQSLVNLLTIFCSQRNRHDRHFHMLTATSPMQIAMFF